MSTILWILWNSLPPVQNLTWSANWISWWLSSCFCIAGSRMPADPVNARQQKSRKATQNFWWIESICERLQAGSRTLDLPSRALLSPQVTICCGGGGQPPPPPDAGWNQLLRSNVIVRRFQCVWPALQCLNEITDLQLSSGGFFIIF